MNVLFIFLIKFAVAQGTFDGLQTGRYELHKSDKKTQAVEMKKKHPARSIASESPAVKAETSNISTSAPVEVPARAEVKPEEKVLAEKEKIEPSISEQVQSLASGEAGQVYDFYREQVHPDDIRNNRVEIEISPGVVSNESKSNYSYREYRSFFQVMNLDANVWFTPLVGISGRYMFSFAADVSGDSSTQSKVAASYEFLDLSLNFRRFFGLSRKSNSTEFNLLYSDIKMKTTADNTSRGRLSSSGIGLGFKTRLPVSADYAWTLGGSFFPKMQHSEGATGVNLNSGSSVESAKVGLDLGGEFKFSRESQIIWNLGVTSEKNLFDGSAGAVDPATNVTPENVSVTNTMLLFNLGYRWGQ